MAFPFADTVRYRYRDNFLEPRVGSYEIYNHVRVASASGGLMRAHDGIDVYAAMGVPVRAPFSGTVIDPAERWIPWAPARYGLTVVIVSDEPASQGYAVLLCHLSRMDVRVGDRVERGQVVGLNGRTGNASAQGILPHVHLELRAPFLMRVRRAGEVRLIDAFNPYPSLRAADPHRP
ncbi:hypothetical protein BH20CHL6_BH20CHL6_17300 [soil metagenome]